MCQSVLANISKLCRFIIHDSKVFSLNFMLFPDLLSLYLQDWFDRLFQSFLLILVNFYKQQIQSTNQYFGSWFVENFMNIKQFEK